MSWAGIFLPAAGGARGSLFSSGSPLLLIDLVIGVLYGAIAALLGGKAEEWMMRIADVLYAIPYLLVVILLMVIIGPGITTIIIALTITGWINMARIVRSQILQIKQQDYVKAAFALGASRRRVLLQPSHSQCHGTDHRDVDADDPICDFCRSFPQLS